METARNAPRLTRGIVIFAILAVFVAGVVEASSTIDMPSVRRRSSDPPPPQTVPPTTLPLYDARPGPGATVLLTETVGH